MAPTVQNLVSTANWRPGFKHPCLNISERWAENELILKTKVITDILQISNVY